MNQIGIMQGRLSSPLDGRIQSFPKHTWREEFFKAREAGLSHIEWIFEADEWQKNPISLKQGIKEIKEIIKETGVCIYSVCADFFMDVPYFTSSIHQQKDLREKLQWLVQQVSAIGASYIDIPFVDASSIPSKNDFPKIMEFLKATYDTIERKNVILTLETSLNPNDFRELLEMINHPRIMANYDTGNSSGIGYNCIEELALYGKWIRTVHIKDRLLHDGTKSLGTGSADFDSFFKMLQPLRYTGPIVLQAAREVEGKEVETAVKNIKFVESYLEKYNIQ